MSRIAKRWKVLAALFALINAGGVLYALRFGEWTHAIVHFGLLFVVFVGWQIVAANRREGDQAMIGGGELERLDSLQNAVDSIALEVERIAEGQRFMAKVRVEPGKGALGAVAPIVPPRGSGSVTPH